MDGDGSGLGENLPWEQILSSEPTVCFRIVITVINMEAENSIVLWPRQIPTEGTLHLNVILEVMFILESLFKCRHIIISAFFSSSSVITKKTFSSLFLFAWWLHSSASPQEREF